MTPNVALTVPEAPAHPWAAAAKRRRRARRAAAALMLLLAAGLAVAAVQVLGILGAGATGGCGGG